MFLDLQLIPLLTYDTLLFTKFSCKIEDNDHLINSHCAMQLTAKRFPECFVLISLLNGCQELGPRRGVIAGR